MQDKSDSFIVFDMRDTASPGILLDGRLFTVSFH